MTRRRALPPCAVAMKCLCAFHANGGSSSRPCNTTEPMLIDGVRAAYVGGGDGIQCYRLGPWRFVAMRGRHRTHERRSMRQAIADAYACHFVDAQGGAQEAVCAVERILANAKRHGDASEPDHEVGDLIDFARQLALAATPQAVLRAAAIYWETHDDWTA